MDSLPDPDSSMSYDALLSSYQRLSHCYTDLFSRNRELSEANRALREECNTFRDNYWSLRYKHQEVADDAINARIESWRHVVRLEELNKELRLLKQADSQPMCVFHLSPTSPSPQFNEFPLPQLWIIQTQIYRCRV